ncbi:unnamed protein product [Polarella glacialis]|uniref:Calmodulin n=1 Tax=Polarella glacialis TaxID=89957 RepID=A0A813GTT1_POLGL|nr:unnamed protein product [Polarella glacialis]
MAGKEAEWKECFDLFDKDSDGKIKASELGDVLRSLGQILTQKEVSDMRAEVGGDLVGCEKFKELAARRPPQPEKQAQVLLQAFQVFDQGHTGSVDMADLRHIVTSLGEKMSPQEFEDICKAAALPSAGRLEYKQAQADEASVKAANDAATEGAETVAKMSMPGGGMEQEPVAPIQREDPEEEAAKVRRKMGQVAIGRRRELT